MILDDYYWVTREGVDYLRRINKIIFNGREVPYPLILKIELLKTDDEYGYLKIKSPHCDFEQLLWVYELEEYLIPLWDVYFRIWPSGKIRVTGIRDPDPIGVSGWRQNYQVEVMRYWHYDRSPDAYTWKVVEDFKEYWHDGKWHEIKKDK